MEQSIQGSGPEALRPICLIAKFISVERTISLGFADDAKTLSSCRTCDPGKLKACPNVVILKPLGILEKY